MGCRKMNSAYIDTIIFEANRSNQFLFNLTFGDSGTFMGVKIIVLNHSHIITFYLWIPLTCHFFVRTGRGDTYHLLIFEKDVIQVLSQYKAYSNNSSF